MLEVWINETLKDAEHLEIPGIVTKPAHKTPMIRYRVDRAYLLKMGVPVQEIDRLYRALFVYSIGFYEMLLKTVEHAQSKYSVLSSLWKVYQVLLEYCCKSNYQMTIIEVTNHFSEEMERLEHDFNQRVAQYEETEHDLRDKLELTSV